MITPMAPASVAVRAFTAKPQSPRSTRAMRPATAPALVSGLQPSVDVPPTSTASTAATTRPEIVGLLSGGPNAAVPNWRTPAIEGGLAIATTGLPNVSTDGEALVT